MEEICKINLWVAVISVSVNILLTLALLRVVDQRKTLRDLNHFYQSLLEKFYNRYKRGTDEL